MAKFWTGFTLILVIWVSLILTSCGSVTIFYDRNGKCLKIKDEFGIYRDCKNDWARDRR